MKYKRETGQELPMFNLKLDIDLLADVFENFRSKSALEYKINPLYGYSVPG